MNKIEINPKILVGKPVIKGTRIPVYLILNLFANGYNEERIIKAYLELNRNDIRAALEFAGSITQFEEKIIPQVTYA